MKLWNTNKIYCGNLKNYVQSENCEIHALSCAMQMHYFLLNSKCVLLITRGNETCKNSEKKIDFDLDAAAFATLNWGRKTWACLSRYKICLLRKACWVAEMCILKLPQCGCFLDIIHTTHKVGDKTQNSQSWRQNTQHAKLSWVRENVSM